MTDPAPLYHLALRLDGQRCLVVGGGPVGARKAASLLECGASVVIVAPEVSVAAELLAASGPGPEPGSAGGTVRIERRCYEVADLAGCRLVVAATGIRVVDRQVYEDATQRGVLVNAADDPEACEFLVPAVLREGPISIGISTGGVSPYLAGWLRRRIGRVVEPEVAVLVELVGRVRSELRAAGRSTELADWAGLVDDSLWPLLEAGRRGDAVIAADEWLRAELDRLPVAEGRCPGGSAAVRSGDESVPG
jgi:precorrin-2 dehydrogenase/sirohydrochlorin ferrochelatase